MKLFYRQLLILTCFISLPVSVLYAQQGTNQYIPVSQHQTIESGTYWSAGQMLPHFATPASQLDGIDMKQGKLCLLYTSPSPRVSYLRKKRRCCWLYRG